MPGCKYVEEIGLVTMLTTMRSAGVTLEVNLREHVTHMLLPSVNKAATLALKPRGNIRVQNRGISGPAKRTYVLQKVKKCLDHETSILRTVDDVSLWI